MSDTESKIDETQTSLDSPKSIKSNTKSNTKNSENFKSQISLNEQQSNHDKIDNEIDTEENFPKDQTNTDLGDKFIEKNDLKVEQESIESNKRSEIVLDKAENKITEKNLTNNEQNSVKDKKFETKIRKSSKSSDSKLKKPISIENFSNDSKPIHQSKSTKPKSTKKNSLPPLRSGKSNEFTHLELKRIKEGLSREVSTIKFPKRKDHTPFVFNDLNPYYDVHHVENLIYSPQNYQHIGYYNRYTATSIVEPWVAYRMERTLPPSVTRSLSHSFTSRSKLESDILNRPSTLEGSTLAPNFPKVIVKKPKDLTGPFYVDDVKAIRSELQKNLNNNNRIEEDRKRTIHDYFRMKLNETADHKGMTNAYHAYLENSPGSKKALKELLNDNNSNIEVK